MKLCSIASGSKGNCIYVSAAGTNLLIDLGISYTDYTARIKSVGLPSVIDGLLVSHAHTDHIKGIQVFLRNNPRTLVYAESSLWGAPVGLGNAIKADPASCRRFSDAFRAGEIDVLPFHTPHDVPSCGFTLDCGGDRVSVVTDLGCMTEGIEKCVSGSDIVLIESNYDDEMLENGPYPYQLKARIRGKYGHLSNADCAACCVRLASKGVGTIILGHLSENNNLPSLAQDTCVAALKRAGFAVGRDVTVAVAGQHSPTQIFLTRSEYAATSKVRAE